MKNIKVLGGHPLLSYTIAAAQQSGCFDRIAVSTDDPLTAEIARHYGAEVIDRPAEFAGDTSPDIDWVRHALQTVTYESRILCYAVLRPTSPFRRAVTIQRAFEQFRPGIDSLRAVEPVSQHPGKMWVIRANQLLPLLPFEVDGVPWHSNQKQVLPLVYVQNASLEIAWSHVALDQRSLAGETVVPFLTHGYEGFDINEPDDWLLAEALIERGAATLPKVDRAPWSGYGSTSKPVWVKVKA